MTLRQDLLKSLAAEGVRPRIVRACDLGDGPHRPFGSALQGIHSVDPLKAPELVGRTRRLRSEPPCPSCGNKSAWRCNCEDGEAA